jgi:uncharacterized protein YjiS (DUF1127 family)
MHPAHGRVSHRALVDAAARHQLRCRRGDHVAPQAHQETQETDMTLALTHMLSGLARRRQARRALLALDDRALEDIGMNRADVEMRFG